MNRNLRTRANRGFTLVELVVVVTVIGLLSAMAIGAYNKVVSDAKQAQVTSLINTVATAKSLFVSDPATTPALIQQFNAGPDAQFALIAPYIRVNGAAPASEAALLTQSGFPSAASIAVGTVDDTATGGTHSDVAPTVSGYP